MKQTNTGAMAAIRDHTFLLVGSGESYHAQIVKGSEALDKMYEEMFGDPQAGNPEEREAWLVQLDDPDEWQHDGDYGPTIWESDVGETDHLLLIRITDGDGIWPLTLIRQKLVLTNAHKLLRRRYKNVPLWSFISDLTGHGSGYSSDLCKACGWNADQKGNLPI